MNAELERIQKYMDGQLLAPAPRGLCHRIAEAIEGRDSAINELAEENGTLRGQVDDLKTAGRQARDDATAALDLVSRIRMALNDNGKRMQDELLVYCRELATLPARVTEMQAGYEESVDRRIALEARIADLEQSVRTMHADASALTVERDRYAYILDRIAAERGITFKNLLNAYRN